MVFSTVRGLASPEYQLCSKAQKMEARCEQRWPLDYSRSEWRKRTDAFDAFMMTSERGLPPEGGPVRTAEIPARRSRRCTMIRKPRLICGKAAGRKTARRSAGSTGRTRGRARAPIVLLVAGSAVGILAFLVPPSVNNAADITLQGNLPADARPCSTVRTVVEVHDRASRSYWLQLTLPNRLPRKPGI